MADVAVAPAAPEAAPEAKAAEPAAVQRATPDAPSALAEWKAIRERSKAQRLRLAASDGEAVDNPSDEPAPEAADDAPSEDVEGADSEDQDGDKPPEKEPTWAQKLRTDLSKKTERVRELETQHKQLEQKHAEEMRAASWEREDVDLISQKKDEFIGIILQAIADSGADSAGALGPFARAFWAEAKTQVLEKRLARGQSTQSEQQKAQGTAKATEQTRQQMGALRKKIPELDGAFTGKDAEMRAWLEERLALDKNGRPVNPGALRTLERDAMAQAKALRFDRQQRAAGQRKQQPARPDEASRPASKTLPGKGAAAGQKQIAAVPKNEQESLAWLRARKAMR